MRYILLALFPFYRWGDGHMSKVKLVPNVTQLEVMAPSEMVSDDLEQQNPLFLLPWAFSTHGFMYPQIHIILVSLRVALFRWYSMNMRRSSFYLMECLYLTSIMNEGPRKAGRRYFWIQEFGTDFNDHSDYQGFQNFCSCGESKMAELVMMVGDVGGGWEGPSTLPKSPASNKKMPFKSQVLV